MNLELNYVENNEQKTHNIKTFDDIMQSLYLNHEYSFLEIEEKIKLPYWKRFGYFYTLNSIISTTLLLPTQHTPLLVLAMTLPAVGGLLFSFDKKASTNIFRIFSFANKSFKTKTALSHDIEIYKKEVALPILAIKKNQYILLQYYHDFYNKYNYCLSEETKDDIENLKYCFEHANNENGLYYNALEHIYRLYQKIQYIKEFEKLE